MQTERLMLRPFSPDDADFILAVLNDRDFMRFVGDRQVRSIEHAKAYLQTGPIASYARHGFGLYAVELKAAHEPVGMCGLLQRASLPDPDIGFAFLPAWRAQGLALEAAQAVLAEARDRWSLARVLAIVDPANERSIGLLRALGMTFLDLRPDDRNGGELACYSIEFPARKETGGVQRPHAEDLR
ncbi:MAG TPA: GNAT family N-acetyltransferase [Woeseiaceae bacterium]|nr:GNAT family N-acetyltransferase [Woeseiaceae bacterium]